MQLWKLTSEQKLKRGCYFCRYRNKLYCKFKKQGVAGTNFKQRTVYKEKDLLFIVESVNREHLGKPYGYLCNYFEDKTEIFQFR